LDFSKKKEKDMKDYITKQERLNFKIRGKEESQDERQSKPFSRYQQLLGSYSDRRKPLVRSKRENKSTMGRVFLRLTKFR
jgi:hypothetical protein